MYFILPNKMGNICCVKCEMCHQKYSRKKIHSKKICYKCLLVPVNQINNSPSNNSIHKMNYKKNHEMNHEANHVSHIINTNDTDWYVQRNKRKYHPNPSDSRYGSRCFSAGLPVGFG